MTSRQLHVRQVPTVTVDKNASRDAMGFSATDAAALRPYADNVMIAGVKSKPELNGKLGMIVGTFDQQSGRIPVLVEGEPAAISLKPENLEGSGLPEGVVIPIHPSGPSEMPQQDQKPTAEAKPKPKRAASPEPSEKRRRKRAASPEPEPEPEPSLNDAAGAAAGRGGDQGAVHAPGRGEHPHPLCSRPPAAARCNPQATINPRVRA